MTKEEGRKRRSDKKVDVKPTIPLELKDAIYRLSYILKIPVMYVAERLVTYAINNTGIRSDIGMHFQRPVYIDGILYHGSLANTPIIKRLNKGEAERIHLRIKQPVAEVLAAFAYALNCSQSKACAILLEASMNDVDFINRYVQQHLERNLDETRMGELRVFMRSINHKKVDQDSWAALLSYMVDEVKKPLESAKEVVNEFIINHWKK